MRKLRKFSFIVALLGALLLSLFPPLHPSLHARAQNEPWPNDPNKNLPICTLPNNQQYPKIVRDSLGNIFIGWQHSTEQGWYRIGVQKLNLRGEIQWPENGVFATPICGGIYQYYDLVPDEMGGVFVIWRTARMDTDNDNSPEYFGHYRIYAQRLDQNGERAWNCLVRVADIDHNLALYEIKTAVSDGDHGVIIAFTGNYLNDLEDPPRDAQCVLAQRLNADGNRLWGQVGPDRWVGVKIFEAWDSQAEDIIGNLSPAGEVVEDGEGGAIIPWWLAYEQRRHLLIQRIDGNGCPCWTGNTPPSWVGSGVNLGDMGPSSTNYAQVATSDGAHGAIIAWKDFRDDSNTPHLYAQRVSSEGDALWGEGGNGVAISGAVGAAIGEEYRGINICSDGEGGAFLVWEEHRPGLGHGSVVLAQRIAPEGNALWQEGGVEVALTHTELEYSPRVAYTGEGKTIVVWYEGMITLPHYDIYAQELDANGQRLWTRDTPVSTAPGNQTWLWMAPNGKGGAVLVWQDNRNYINTRNDIYAQRVPLTLDEDGDGVADSEEQGPGGDDSNYDGNHDGTPDWQQPNVASLHTFDGSYYVTLACSGGELRNVFTMDNPHPQDAPQDVNFPWGFFSFEIELDPGVSEAIVTLYLPQGSNPTTYYKYGPTPDNQTDHWYEFRYDGTGAEINGNVITLHFVDGERGDADLAPNGVIVDPSGPAIFTGVGNQLPSVSDPSPEDGATSVPTSPELSILATDPDGDPITVTFYNAADDSVIGEVGNVASGARATVTWSGLDYTTTYSWYVEVSDGVNPPARSDTWSFTTVTPGPEGDVNQDGQVDSADLGLVARAFGSTPGSPNWNQDADLNQDGIVDIFDLVLVGRNFGRP